jgi:hypothetical protein
MTLLRNEEKIAALQIKQATELAEIRAAIKSFEDRLDMLSERALHIVAQEFAMKTLRELSKMIG